MEKFAWDRLRFLRGLPVRALRPLAFVQPDAMLRATAEAVVHEAAASGLPLILSDACGAGVHLLRHLYNGYSFPTGDAASLARAMVAMHRLSDERRTEFGQASFELSKQYTPQRWAETLSQGIEWLTAGR